MIYYPSKSHTLGTGTAIHGQEVEKLMAQAHVRIDELTYVSEGHVVPARIFRPEQVGQPAPGVLLCPGRLREIEGLAFLGEALAEQGMVVLATAYRGMDMRTDDQDCLDGLDELCGLPGVDPRRIGVLGHSRGAMASLRIAARDERVRSVVSLQPVTDLDRYTRATREYAPSRYKVLSEGLGGSPEEVPETYAALSALHFADRIRVPVLLVAGTMDLHSPLDHSVWMRDALVAAGNPEVRLEVLDFVGHFFERMYAGYVRETISQLAVDWLARTLAPAYTPAQGTA